MLGLPSERPEDTGIGTEMKDIQQNKKKNNDRREQVLQKLGNWPSMKDHEDGIAWFLTLCPECDEPVSLKDMKDHQKEAHKQVKCNPCHQSMQQYQLEHHEAKEYHKRATKCMICELEMPFNKLQEHLNTCASQTEWCWECNKYIMLKDQSKHKKTCQNSGLSCHKDVNFQTSEASTNATFICPTGTDGNLCQKCNKSFPDNQYFQHLSKCGAAHEPTKHLAGQPNSEPISHPPKPLSLAPSSSSGNAVAWRDVRPKEKGRDQSLFSKTLLKHPKNKKIGSPSTASGGLFTSPEALKDTQSFDMLVTCTHCNILLPLPTLQKHEIRCLHSTLLNGMKQESSHGEKEDSFYSIHD